MPTFPAHLQTKNGKKILLMQDMCLNTNSMY